MNNTTHENIIPIGSATRVILIGVVEVNITHSSKYVDWYHTTLSIWGITKINVAQINKLACLKIFKGIFNIHIVMNTLIKGWKLMLKVNVVSVI